LKIYKNTKMKRVILIIAIVAISTASWAQKQGSNANAKSKLEVARIAMITERLNLTPGQAEKFWPLYNEFAQERRMMQQQALQARKGMDMQNLTEEQSKTLMQAHQKFKQDKLNLENKYANKMNNVISARQMVALRKAEDDFRQMILNRLEMRKRQQMQRDQMMNQREHRRQQGNN
jgi:hypothetical protein